MMRSPLGRRQTLAKIGNGLGLAPVADHASAPAPDLTTDTMESPQPAPAACPRAREDPLRAKLLPPNGQDPISPTSRECDDSRSPS